MPRLFVGWGVKIHIQISCRRVFLTTMHSARDDARQANGSASRKGVAGISNLALAVGQSFTALVRGSCSHLPEWTLPLQADRCKLMMPH